MTYFRDRLERALTEPLPFLKISSFASVHCMTSGVYFLHFETLALKNRTVDEVFETYNI